MIQFIKQFIKHPSKVGAILPSSRYLAAKMMSDVDFSKCQTIVEYGPGTGVFTKEIIRRKKADTKFLVIEQNTEFYQMLVQKYGTTSNVFIVNGSVEQVETYLETYKMSGADLIISGLPFTSLPKKVSADILDRTVHILNREGKFITFQYSLVKKHVFEAYLKIVQCKRELRNIPPAYVLTMNCKAGQL